MRGRIVILTISLAVAALVAALVAFSGPSDSTIVANATSLLPQSLSLGGNADHGFWVEDCSRQQGDCLTIVPTNSAWKNNRASIPAVESIEEWGRYLGFCVVDKGSGDDLEYVVYNVDDRAIMIFASKAMGREWLRNADQSEVEAAG